MSKPDTFYAEDYKNKHPIGWIIYFMGRKWKLKSFKENGDALFEEYNGHMTNPLTVAWEVNE